MVSCEELKRMAPTCFEPIDIVEIGDALPNYAKAYACLWEIATAFNIPLKDIWYEALIEMVTMCNK
jgi:hypothetical protein